MKMITVVAGTLLIAGCGTASGASPEPVAAERLPLPSASTSAVDLAPTTTSPDAEILVMLTNLGGAGVEAVGGIECATEMAYIAVAAERYQERVGSPPQTFDDLAPDLDVEVTLWAFDADSGLIAPSAGSPCPDIFGEQDDVDAAHACVVDQRTLETAVEATFAQTGELPLNQQQLVDDGMIRELNDDFTVINGEVDVVSGSACEGLLEEREAELDADAKAAVDDPADCAVRRRTLEVAVEAFYVEFGEIPATEAALVETGMLRAEFADFDLAADASVVVAPGSLCE